MNFYGKRSIFVISKNASAFVSDVWYYSTVLAGIKRNHEYYLEKHEVHRVCGQNYH